MKKYVLIAEDEKFYAKILKAKLTKEGCDVAVAVDGEFTLKIASKKRPDLILLDLVMPVKDGFEVLKELKANSKLRNVKVVVLSNLGQKEDVKKAKELGADDFIIKTNVSIQELVKKVKKHLK